MNNSELSIETPERIVLRYALADMPARAGAWFLDVLIQLACLILAITALVQLELLDGIFDDGGLELINGMGTAFYLILIFALKWFYFVFFECVSSGSSPGKLFVGLRVVKANGESLDFQAILIRNLVRAVDDFPVLPLLGGLFAVCHKQRMRLGDLAAGTIVVKVNKQRPRMPKEWEADRPHLGVPYPATGASPVALKAALDESSLYVLRNFMSQRDRLPPAMAEKIASDLACQVAKKTGLERGGEEASQDFLMRVYDLHRSDTGGGQG